VSLTKPVFELRQSQIQWHAKKQYQSTASEIEDKLNQSSTMGERQLTILNNSLPT